MSQRDRKTLRVKLSTENRPANSTPRADIITECENYHSRLQRTLAVKCYAVVNTRNCVIKGAVGDMTLKFIQGHRKWCYSKRLTLPILTAFQSFVNFLLSAR